jgi:hypothetical protein
MAAASQSYTESEDGYLRTFKVNEKTAFLAVCYDSFGIRHNQLKNPGVDIILNCVHSFSPTSEGGSRDL